LSSNRRKRFLDTLTDNSTFTVLPTLRNEYGKSNSITVSLSKSIKITKNTSSSLLSIKLLQLIRTKVLIYNWEITNCEVFLMSRPWLTDDEFNAPLSEVNKVLEQNLENEIKEKVLDSNKSSKLKVYDYENIFMDKYGDPIFDSKSNQVGFKLNTNEYASVKTFYNKESNLCKEVQIKEFNKKNLTFENETLISWLDVQTEKGFTRNFNDFKYFSSKMILKIKFTI